MTGRTESRTVRGKPRYRAAVYVGVREAERSGGRLEHRTYYGPWRSRLRRSPSDPSADADLDRLRDELEALLSGPVSASDPGTVSDLLTRWQRDCVAPDKRPNTIRHHAKNAALHIVPRLGMCRAAALSPADVAEWQAAEIAAGAAPKSVRNYRATLHACYAWAHALGLVPSNPVSKVKPPRLAERTVTAPTYAEARAYLEALSKTRLYPGLVLAAFAGLRRGEALAVRWSDVDLAAGTVTVNKQMTGRGATLGATATKTAKGRRTVPLPAVAVDLLSAVKASRRRELLPRQKWDDAALVCGGRAGQPITPDGFTSELYKRVRQHGLAPLHLHQLRHTFATEALRAGERPDVVAAMLGHAHVSTTLGIYADVVEADKRAAADRVQAAWEASGEREEAAGEGGRVVAFRQAGGNPS